MKKLIVMMIFAFVFLISGCNSFQVESIFKTRDIVIDGNDEDWSDAKYYVKEHDVVFGVMNDNDFLYLCFYPTTSKLTKQILEKGLTLWINNDAKKKKYFGIHFPMGMLDFMKRQPEEEDEQKMSRQNRDDTNFDSKQMKKMVKSISMNLEIIGPEKDQVKKIDFNELKGVEIGFDFEKELFTYELKIPLEDNPQFTASVGAETNSKIAIGFEVPKLDMGAMKEKMKGMERPSMGGGREGKPGSGMNKGLENVGEKQQTTKKLELWTIIQLVEN